MAVVKTCDMGTLHDVGPDVVLWNQDSSVGIVTGYGLDDQGVRVRVLVGSRIFSSPNRPDRLLDTLSLLSNGY
jgi:hypothetical protein